MTRFRTEPLGKIAPAESRREIAPLPNPCWLLNLDQIEKEAGYLSERTLIDPSTASASTHQFTVDHVLYSKLRPNLSKVVCPKEGGLCTTELVRLKPDQRKIDRQFLTYFLRSASFVGFASQAVAGAKTPRLMMNQLWHFPVPVPPPADQRRIVEILDLADELRRKRREGVEIARRIPTAAFHKAFDGVLDRSKAVTVEQVFDDTSRMGPRLPRTTYLSSGRFPVIDQGADMVAGFTDMPEDLYTGPLPVILFGDHTRIFKLIRQPFAIGADGVRLLSPKSGWFPEFAFQQCRMLEIPAVGYSRHYKFLREQGFFHAPPAQQKHFAEAFREHESVLEKKFAAQSHLDTLFTTLLERAFAGGLTREGRSGTMRETLQEMEIQARRQP